MPTLTTSEQLAIYHQQDAFVSHVVVTYCLERAQRDKNEAIRSYYFRQAIEEQHKRAKHYEGQRWFADLALSASELCNQASNQHA